MSNENEENEDLIEASEYSSKSDFSKAAIVQKSLEVCFNLRAKEMLKGYFNVVRNSKTGEETKTWIGDTRKSFISSVDGLKAIVYPEIMRDSVLKKYISSFEENKKKLFNKYAYHERVQGRDKEGKIEIKTTSCVFMPEEDYPILTIKKVMGIGLQFEYIRGLWNLKIEQYWNELLALYDDLFAQINLLCDRNNYFKQGSSF